MNQTQHPISAQPSEFYLRQASVPTVGSQGLAKLRASSVAIVGVGGVGSSAAYYLARSAIGRIKLIDHDIIEPHNLQRIHSAKQSDLYHPKAEVVSTQLSEFDPSCRIEAVVDTLAETNMDELLDGVSMVFDGLDNFRTRYVINKFAVRNETPYMFASAVGEQAHLTIFNPPITPCLECILPGVTDRFADSCETLGVTPTVTGLAGAIGASSVIRFLIGSESQLINSLLTIDMDGPDLIVSQIKRRRECSVCGSSPIDATEAQPAVTLLCGEHTANAPPSRRMIVRLPDASEAIKPERILATSDSVLVFIKESYTISLFKNGRLLIGGIDNENQAAAIADSIWRTLWNTRACEIVTQNKRSESVPSRQLRTDTNCP